MGQPLTQPVDRLRMDLWFVALKVDDNLVGVQIGSDGGDPVGSTGQARIGHNPFGTEAFGGLHRSLIVGGNNHPTGQRRLTCPLVNMLDQGLTPNKLQRLIGPPCGLESGWYKGDNSHERRGDCGVKSYLLNNPGRRV